MKNKNLLKNILKKSIVGFTVGVTFLMLAYVCIFFISGESIFRNEISQLQNIKILIYQIIVTGMSYFLIFIIFHIYSFLQDEYISNHPYKSVLTIMLTSLIILVLIGCVLSNTKIYSVNIGMLNIIIFIVTFALAGVCFVVKKFKESNLIKKINQKLKEKNR